MQDVATAAAEPAEHTRTLDPRPSTRRMTVVAQDPSVRKADGTILMAVAEVPAEDLIDGPIGYRVQVVDYDATSGEYHGAHRLPACHDLELDTWKTGDPAILEDYAFHAQNVYALVMQTLARFEFALGRRIGWSFEMHQLKIAPHGMLDANAFYSRKDEGLVLGHFVGRDGRKVFTALSHDVVVHETTHALIDALRERYMDPSGPDQAAFHEGFADIVALLSVFAQVEVVKEMLLRTEVRSLGDLIPLERLTADALRAGPFTAVAKELGSELQVARGDALRRSTDLPRDDAWKKDEEFDEPHRRGEVLVAAVMNAFIETWSRRLLDAATPGQTSHQAVRVAEEGAEIAGTLLTMWIRALDYMPPVHVEFGDTLSAALTADLEVRPNDRRLKLRECLLDSFTTFGIAPASPREDPRGIWNRAPRGLHYERVRFESMQADKDEVFRFIWENRAALGVREGAHTKVLSVRPCRRVGDDGFVLHETVAEYYQVARLTDDECRAKRIRLPEEYLEVLRREKGDALDRRAARAGVSEPDEGEVSSEGSDEASDEAIGALTPVYGGGVLVFDEFGRLKYHIHNKVFGSRQTARLKYLWESGLLRTRTRDENFAAARLSALHRQRAIDARRFAGEGW
jgi:hypothetical protein